MTVKRNARLCKPAPVFTLLLTLSMLSSLAVAAKLGGTVKDLQQQTVSGALLKISSADSRFKYMVVSKAEGRYVTPEMPDGRYTLQAFGDKFQSQSISDVVIVGDDPLVLDVLLDAPRVLHQLPKKDYKEAEYAGLMPEGVGKQELLSKCTVCHSSGNFVARRKTAADWKDTVVKMRYRWEQNPELVEKILATTGKKVSRITDDDIEVMSKYLAANFSLEAQPLIGVPHPDYHLPRELLKGEAQNFYVMEMRIGTGMVGSYDIDERGNIWVSEKTSGILGHLDPKTLRYTQVYTPPVNVTEEYFGAVSVDPEQKIWFTSNVVPDAQWFQYDPVSRQIINKYDVAIPSRPGGDIYFNSLVFPAGNAIWAVVTAFHSIYKLDRQTREVKMFPMREGQHPFGITIAGDGNVWYAADNDDMLVRIDPATDKMTNFKLSPNTGPRRLAVDTSGDIWAASINRSAVIKIDHRTGKTTEYEPPSAGMLHGIKLEKILQGIDVDRKNNLVWFSEYEAVKLGRLDPATRTFSEFPLVTAESQPWIVQVDPVDPNRIWWNSRNGSIGYLQLLE